MQFTKEEAIEACIEHWTHLARTGGGCVAKALWLKKHYEPMRNSCALCQLVSRVCRLCPFYKLFGHCMVTSSPYWQWQGAETRTERKKYAKLCVEALKEL